MSKVKINDSYPYNPQVSGLKKPDKKPMIKATVTQGKKK